MTETSRVHYQQHPAAKEELLALYPGKAFGEPADGAQCALYMASDAARFMNGSVVVLDGVLSAVHRLPSLRSNNGPLDPTEVLHDSDTANIRTRNPD